MGKAFQMDNGKGFIFGQWENFQFNGQVGRNFTVSTQIALGDQLLQHTHHSQPQMDNGKVHQRIFNGRCTVMDNNE